MRRVFILLLLFVCTAGFATSASASPSLTCLRRAPSCSEGIAISARMATTPRTAIISIHVKPALRDMAGIIAE